MYKLLFVGSLAVGIGCSQLRQFSSILNIPSISPPLYQKTETDLSNIIESASTAEMKKVGTLEAQLAVEKKSLDECGIPSITVIADGAWSKRSYRSNYNALSGVGVIIGNATKKNLYVGVRNKYCLICQKAKNCNKTCKQHTCYKNWSGTSTSMEADIIVNGFKNSMSTHGIKYLRLIGDGDSSVTKKLQIHKPYGTQQIEKIECVNHLLRNTCNKLRELSRSTRSSTHQPIPLKLRKKLEISILRFRVAIKKAAMYHTNTNKTYSEKLLGFKKDIINCPNHIFGNHTKCETYFCNRYGNEEDLSHEVEVCGLGQDIRKCMQRIINNSSSIMADKNNNAAEQFNSLLNKFMGGKRVCSVPISKQFFS